MKRTRLIYAFLLAVILPLFTACSNDDDSNAPAKHDGKVTVHLRISQAGSTGMRAGTATYDQNALADELMNVWTVVITNEAGNVEKILACKPDENSREIDPIEKDLELTENTKYHFYSFANISPKYALYLLGIGENTPPASDDTFSSDYTDGDIKEITASGTITKEVAMAKTIAIDGNGFSKFDEKTPNGFLSYGIPMSNVQTITVEQPTSEKKYIDLIVVRLLAKIKLEITNKGTEDVTISSITLTDVTQYEEGKDNLKLFPNYTVEDPNGADEKVDYTHGDIRPNLTSGVTTGDFTKEVSQIIEHGEKETITFYVNESATPTDKNAFNRFYLKLNLLKGTDNTEVRYKFIDDSNATGFTGEWNYIARNDYRIIPIALTDYKFEMIPYDFPAIGVYPASVKEEDGLNTITFHDYGHFHLVPKVTKFTAMGTKPLSYGTENDTWSFANDTFKDSWKTWESYEASVTTPTTYYDNSVGQFYATTSDVANADGSAKINDGDDAGGIPVWYVNGTEKPQWAPDWSPETTPNYQPFIFGYIADPGDKLSVDRKVYHEFTIQVNNGSTPQLLTYRLYMILDTDQMLYRQNGAAPVRHTHGH